MNRIAQARADAGLSAKELTAKLGVDAATVSNWEAGRRQLTLERLIGQPPKMYIKIELDSGRYENSLWGRRLVTQRAMQHARTFCVKVNFQ